MDEVKVERHLIFQTLPIQGMDSLRRRSLRRPPSQDPVVWVGTIEHGLHLTAPSPAESNQVSSPKWPSSWKTIPGMWPQQHRLRRDPWASLGVGILDFLQKLRLASPRLQAGEELTVSNWTAARGKATRMTRSAARTWEILRRHAWSRCSSPCRLLGFSFWFNIPLQW